MGTDSSENSQRTAQVISEALNVVGLVAAPELYAQWTSEQGADPVRTHVLAMLSRFVEAIALLKRSAASENATLFKVEPTVKELQQLVEGWQGDVSRPTPAIVECARRCLRPIGFPVPGAEAAEAAPAAPAAPEPPAQPKPRGEPVELKPVPEVSGAEDQMAEVRRVMDRLVKHAHARLAFAIDRAGQLVTASGDLEEEDVDSTSLASLTAGNVATTDGIAKLLASGEFTSQFHEGADTHVHIRLVGKRVILVVIFDSKSSLGLVRLRAREAGEALSGLFDALLDRTHQSSGDVLDELTDGDLEELFSH